jgi:hypothetical protein
MRLSIYIGVLLVVMLCLCSSEQSVFAQNDTATFQGSITDTQGKPIRGASVTIEGVNFKRKIRPNRKGQFHISLPAGVYKITVKKSGFATYELTDLQMTPGNNLSYAFRLECSCPQSAVRSGYR